MALFNCALSSKRRYISCYVSLIMIKKRKKEADINLSEVTSSPYFFPPSITKEIKFTQKLRVKTSSII